jgi:hypothetical protein
MEKEYFYGRIVGWSTPYNSYILCYIDTQHNKTALWRKYIMEEMAIDIPYRLLGDPRSTTTSQNNADGTCLQNRKDEIRWTRSAKFTASTYYEFIQNYPSIEILLPNI